MIDDRTTDGLADLLRGAAILSHAGNRTAAIAALGSAIAIAPDDLTAHRRLAATVAVMLVAGAEIFASGGPL